MRKFKTNFDGSNYIVILPDERHITVERNGILKSVPVVEDFGYTYKLLKTRINADGGAAGLYEFLENAFIQGFMECLARKVILHICDTMR